MGEGSEVYVDFVGNRIRVTEERILHVLEHPEMAEQLERIRQTLLDPEVIIATVVDGTVHVYHRYYETTPVTSKFLHVVVKMYADDAFTLTAYFSSRRKRGTEIWLK